MQTRCIGETPEKDNTEGTRKGRRNEHTRDRKVRCALDSGNNRTKKPERLGEIASPTLTRVSNKSPFTNGAAPGISASFLNNLENVLQQPSGGSEIGKYWMEQGGYQNGWNNGGWIPTISRGATPVSVSVDTADLAPTASASAPPTPPSLTASGFWLQWSVTALTNTARLGGNWTVSY